MRITLCLALVLLAATSACSSSESEDLYDVWITPGNSIYLSLNEDDSWGIAYHEGIDPFDWGTFTFDGELLTFFIDPDSVSCYTTGTYDAAFTAEGDLELNVVEDPCRLRAEDLTGTLVPSSGAVAAPTTTVEATTTTTVAEATTSTVTTEPSDGVDQVDEVEAAMDQFIAAWNTGDPDAVVAAFADEFYFKGFGPYESERTDAESMISYVEALVPINVSIERVTNVTEDDSGVMAVEVIVDSDELGPRLTQMEQIEIEGGTLSRLVTVSWEKTD